MLPVRRGVERRHVVLTGAVVSFAAAFGLQQLSHQAADGVGLLYVLPVALVALELGLLAGAASALFGLGLIGVGALIGHRDLDLIGFGSSLAALLAVGLVAGRFGERMRDAQRRQRLLLESGLRLAHLEAADNLAAALAEEAAKVASPRGVRVELASEPPVEAGRLEPGACEQHLTVAVRGSDYGTLIVSWPRRSAPEDHASLQILALQAAVAAESRRLLQSERERAAIHAELQEARRHLDDRAEQLRGLIERQEAERDYVAEELHEQAAQTLAAILLGLAALGRELGPGPTGPRLDELRSDIGATLRSLRSLAAGLRPALGLGLQPALQSLVERAGIQERACIEVPAHYPLAGEAERIAYRVVEEAIAAVDPVRFVRVGLDRDGGHLRIYVEAGGMETAPERLAVLRARTEIAGGTLTVADGGLHAELPLRR